METHDKDCLGFYNNIDQLSIGGVFEPCLLESKTQYIWTPNASLEHSLLRRAMYLVSKLTAARVWVVPLV
jgi:hypothetical protein